MEDDDRTIMPGRPGPPDADATRILTATPVAAGVPTAPDGEYLPKGYRLQEFEVQARQGQGGFSIVYRAWDHALKRTVALKEYMPTSMARRLPDCSVALQSERHRETFDIGRRSFIEEAVTLAKFDHPALVRVYRNFEANGTAYMVMQLVLGQTLDDVAKSMPVPTEAWLMDLLDPLTAALQVVHAERIVHRDIAPDNVMLLEGTQRPLLLDFGAARQVIGDNTQNPTAMLKPSYAPIEQYPESGLQQGAYTDIYALSGVVHRLLTGSAPPNSQSRVLKDSYQPLATRLKGKYNARLLRAVDHGLASRPDQRPQTIADFRRELGLEERRSGSDRPRAEPGGGHGRMALWAGLAAMGLLAVGVALFVWVTSEAPIEPGAQAAAESGAPSASPSPAPAPAGPTGAAALPPAAVDAAVVAVDPDQAFQRVLQAASADLGVTLSIANANLKVDVTPLRIRLQSSQAGYFYVLIYDTDREVRLLFPNAINEENRIGAGQTVSLPAKRIDRSSGLEQIDTLIFSEPTGPARLLAIVSASPLDLSAVTKGPDGEYSLLLKDLEAGGVQAQQPGRPVYAGRVQCPSAVPCEERFGAADARFQVIP